MSDGTLGKGVGALTMANQFKMSSALLEAGSNFYELENLETTTEYQTILPDYAEATEKIATYTADQDMASGAFSISEGVAGGVMGAAGFGMSSSAVGETSAAEAEQTNWNNLNDALGQPTNTGATGVGNTANGGRIEPNIAKMADQIQDGETPAAFNQPMDEATTNALANELNAREADGGTLGDAANTATTKTREARQTYRNAEAKSKQWLNGTQMASEFFKGALDGAKNLINAGYVTDGGNNQVYQKVADTQMGDMGTVRQQNDSSAQAAQVTNNNLIWQTTTGLAVHV